MKYADKLKNPLWVFKSEYIGRMRLRRGLECDDVCESCGEPADFYQFHHRRYIEGREPWEYDDGDMLLVCESCHDRIHRVEKRIREWVLSVEPYILYQFEDFLDELLACENQQAACGRAKHAVRGLNYEIEASAYR